MVQTLFENVLTGGFGAGLLAFLGWIIHRLRDRKIENRYPIGGDYASTFEDRVDGSLVVSKARVHLKQKGRSLKGFTVDLETGRKWNLEGQLVGNGRLVGSYEAENPNDSGLGGFFLELKESGNLEGLWAGFDHVNHRVTAGKYNFLVA